MSKAVLISIQPKWCELIASGKKTIEIRKSRPKLRPPFKCYIYCTKADNPISLCTHDSHDYTCGKTYRYSGGGEVIGEFVCDRLFQIRIYSDGLIQNYNFENLQASCVPYEDIVNYIGAGFKGGGWHISDLVIYDKPKELSEFRPYCEYGEAGECVEIQQVACPYQWRDFNPDGSVNIVSCTKRVRRPPQSWCYVEE